MRIFLFATLCCPIALGCSGPHASDVPVASPVADIDGDLVKPRFVFSAPDGFEWNDEQQIWNNKVTRTSISLAHAQGTSFETIVDDFIADRMLAANMELISKDIRDVVGRPTLLVHGNRLNAKYPQQFCTVAFGTETGCAQLTAIYPKAADEEMKKQIETLLLSSRYKASN